MGWYIPEAGSWFIHTRFLTCLHSFINDGLVHLQGSPVSHHGHLFPQRQQHGRHSPRREGWRRNTKNKPQTGGNDLSPKVTCDTASCDSSDVCLHLSHLRLFLSGAVTLTSISLLLQATHLTSSSPATNYLFCTVPQEIAIHTLGK